MFSVVECCKGVFTMKMAPIYLIFVIKMKVTAGLYLTCEGNSKLHESEECRLLALPVSPAVMS